MTEKRERETPPAVPAWPDPVVATARPGDLVLFVLPEDVDMDAATQLVTALQDRHRPGGVEFLVVCGPRVVVVEGEGRG